MRSLQLFLIQSNALKIKLSVVLSSSILVFLTYGGYFVAEIGWTNQTVPEFREERHKNVYLAFFLPDIATTMEFLNMDLLKIYNEDKKLVGQKIVCPPGVKKWKEHVPQVPHQITPQALLLKL